MRVGPCIAITFLALLSVGARADTSNPVNGSGGGFSGSGTLYATSNGNGSYTITGITGTGVTGLIAPGGFNGNDNLLYPNSTPTLDANGFGFTDTMGDTDFQVDLGYSSAMDGYAAYILDSDGVQMDIPVDFSLGEAPKAGLMLNSMLMEPLIETTAFNFSYSVLKETAPATPEPSSLALLGTGIVGLAEMVRRRMRA